MEMESARLVTLDQNVWLWTSRQCLTPTLMASSTSLMEELALRTSELPARQFLITQLDKPSQLTILVTLRSMAAHTATGATTKMDCTQSAKLTNGPTGKMENVPQKALSGQEILEVKTAQVEQLLLVITTTIVNLVMLDIVLEIRIVEMIVATPTHLGMSRTDVKPAKSTP